MDVDAILIDVVTSIWYLKISDDKNKSKIKIFKYFGNVF